MSVEVPWPPPNRHTDAIRDLQERFQLLERNLTQRLQDQELRMAQFMASHSAPRKREDFRDYDYSKAEDEQ